MNPALVLFQLGLLVLVQASALWEQDDSALGAGAPSQVFSIEPETQFGTFASDDFIVPEGKIWNIDQIKVFGYYENGCLDTNCISRSYWNWAFIEDDPETNLPKSQPTGDVIYRQILIPNNSSDISNQFTANKTTNELTINITSSTFRAGRYWVSVWISLDYTVQNQWHWHTCTENSNTGLPFGWSDTRNQFAGDQCKFWWGDGYNYCYVGSYPALSFGLYGAEENDSSVPPVDPTNTHLLFNQLTETGSESVESQNFIDNDNPRTTVYSADDFQVPASDLWWSITSITVLGSYDKECSTCPPTGNVWNIAILRAVPYSSPGSENQNQPQPGNPALTTTSPGGASLYLATNLSAAPEEVYYNKTRLTFNLTSSPFNLTAGNYWISVWPKLASGTSTGRLWSWGISGSQNGQHMTFYDPFEIFGNDYPCSTGWRESKECGRGDGNGVDLLFALRGMAPKFAPSPSPVPISTTATVTSTTGLTSTGSSAGSTTSTSQETKSSEESYNTLVGIIVGSVAGCCGVFLIIIIISVLILGLVRANHQRKVKLRTKTVQMNDDSDSDVEMGVGKSSQININILKWEELIMGSLIGSGIFGNVYRAKWRGTYVAVKLLIKPLNSNFDPKEELKREASLIANVSNHQNIIPFIGIVSDDRHLAVVTHYCHEGSLDTKLFEDNFDIPIELKVQIAKDVSSAVLHLHKNGVIHKDISARHVLLDDRGRAYLSGFGLCDFKNMDSKSKEFITNFESITHMAPESLKSNKDFSEKTDSFGFGVFLWELETQCIPWEGKDQSWVINNITEKSPAKRKTIPVDDVVDPVFKSLIERCVSFKPQDRPTFEEILSELTLYHVQLTIKASEEEETEWHSSPNEETYVTHSHSDTAEVTSSEDSYVY